MTTITIAQITTRTVNTQYGERRVHDIVGTDGKKYTAWQHPIADAWEEGQTVSVEVEPGKPYKGQPQWNIKFPKEGRSSKVAQWTPPPADLDEIKGMLTQIMQEVLEMKDHSKSVMQIVLNSVGAKQATITMPQDPPESHHAGRGDDDVPPF